MLRKIGLLVLVGLLAAAAPVRVDNAYEIKLKKNSKEDITQRKNEETEESHVKIEGPDGKLINEEKRSKTTIEEYKETILAKEKGKRATKLRREYSKAILKADDKEKTLPYDGKTLLIEKKRDKYHFTIEGGEEVGGDDAQFLDDTFNKRRDDSDSEQLVKACMPKKPVAVNDTWKIDPDELVKALTKGQLELVDQSKVTGKGKLLHAYKKDGRQYGVFVIEVKLPLKGDIPLGKKKAPIREGSILTHMKVDTCIDGTSNDAVSEMSMNTDLVAGIKTPGGQELKLILHATQKGREIEKDLSRK